MSRSNYQESSFRKFLKNSYQRCDVYKNGSEANLHTDKTNWRNYKSIIFALDILDIEFLHDSEIIEMGLGLK